MQLPLLVIFISPTSSQHSHSANRDLEVAGMALAMPKEKIPGDLKESE